MTNTNEWYIFNGGAIDKKTCDRIKRWASKKWETSTVSIDQGDLTNDERKTGRKGDYKLDSKSRISDIAWCNEQWLYDIVWGFMKRANQESGWRFDIKSCESCQVTRYKKGGFYGFHNDGAGDHLSAYDIPDNHFLDGRVRKLSMSIILNDNFEGGAFEFATYNKEKCTITPIKATTGSIIIFPSSVEHRVAPVTKGIRYSVVCWFLGPPFV